MIRILLFVTVLVFTANGFCFQDVAKLEFKSDGTIDSVCQYGNYTLHPGDHVRTEDCMDCSCQHAALTCCGYGIKAAVYAPAPGCVIKADGCKVLMVKANDESRDCMTGEKVLNTQ